MSLGRIDRRAVGERVELCKELVDALHLGCESLVVERSVVGEREGSAAEVGECEVELMRELGVGVGGVGVNRGCDVAEGGLAASVFDVAERVEVEDLGLLAGEFVRLAVKLTVRGEGLWVE